MHPLVWVSLIFRDSGLFSSVLAFLQRSAFQLPPSTGPRPYLLPQTGIKRQLPPHPQPLTPWVAETSALTDQCPWPSCLFVIGPGISLSFKVGSAFKTFLKISCRLGCSVSLCLHQKWGSTLRRLLGLAAFSVAEFTLLLLLMVMMLKMR